VFDSRPVAKVLSVLGSLLIVLPLAAQAEPERILSRRGITFSQVQWVPSATRRLPALEVAMLKNLPDYVAMVSRTPSRTARYSYHLVDLNGDSKLDAIVYPVGFYFCGTGGCTLMIFQGVGTGFQLVGKASVSRTPIIVTPTKTNGWKNLIRTTAGGGFPLNYSYLRYRPGTGAYQPEEEVPTNTTVQGTGLFATGGREFELKVR
jgi:hypothetical protein